KGFHGRLLVVTAREEFNRFRGPSGCKVLFGHIQNHLWWLLSENNWTIWSIQPRPIAMAGSPSQPNSDSGSNYSPSGRSLQRGGRELVVLSVGFRCWRDWVFKERKKKKYRNLSGTS